MCEGITNDPQVPRPAPSDGKPREGTRHVRQAAEDIAQSLSNIATRNKEGNTIKARIDGSGISER
jgi:hypothetical protein